MTNTGIVYHPDYLLHDTGFSHPEKKERLEAIMRSLEKTGLLKELVRIEPVPAATIEMLSAIHDENYIFSVRDTIEKGNTCLDSADTLAGKGSWRAAILGRGRGMFRS